MIRYYCDACGKGVNEILVSTLHASAFVTLKALNEGESNRNKYILCPDCARFAVNPVIEEGKKYRARDSHGNVGEVEIAEITVMKEIKNDKL